MPRQTASFEAAVAASISDWLHRYIPAVAESLGPLPDTVDPTSKEKARRWSLRTDKVEPGPMTDALADEALAMILEEHRAQQKPAPDRDALAKLVAARVNGVLYEYRKDVFGRGNPLPAARVKEAERYARLAQKEQPTTETVGAAPSPAPAPPSVEPAMPTEPPMTESPPTEPSPVQGGY